MDFKFSEVVLPTSEDNMSSLRNASPRRIVRRYCIFVPDMSVPDAESHIKIPNKQQEILWIVVIKQGHFEFIRVRLF